MKRNIYLLTMMLVLSFTSNAQTSHLKQKRNRKILTTNSSQSQLKAATVNQERIEALMGYFWEEDAWVESDKHEFEYNEDNQFEVATYYEKEEDEWTVSSKISYLYYEDGSLKSYTDYEWIDEAWKESLMYVYEYNTKGEVISEVYWGMSGVFEPSEKTEYFYLLNGDLDYEIAYDAEGGSWNLSRKTEYSYNSDQNLEQEMYLSWNGSDWDNSSKHVYEMDLNGKPSLCNEYTWSTAGSSGSWILRGIWEYSFDNRGNPLHDSYKEDSGEGMKEVEYYEYNYDPVLLFEDVIPLHEEYFSTFYFEDIYNKPLNEIGKDWNSTNNAWEYSWKLEYIYSGTPTKIEERESLLKVYPTKVINEVTVETNGKAVFKIYDLSGNCVFETQVEGTQNVSLSSLNNGMYIYTLIEGREKSSGRFVKK